jgi:biotin transport system permease protein
MMEPLYMDGRSPLHRAPAGAKLAVLVAAGMALFAVHRLDVLGACCVVAALLVASSGASARTVWRHLRALAPVLAVVAAFAWYFEGPARAAEMLLRVGTLVGLALAVTLTTRTTALIAVCEHVLRPLEKLGWVDAGRVALALALTLRFIPEIWRNYQDIREAQAARGLGRNALALAVPLLVRTFKRADEVADAIEARGG